MPLVQHIAYHHHYIVNLLIKTLYTCKSSLLSVIVDRGQLCVYHQEGVIWLGSVSPTMVHTPTRHWGTRWLKELLFCPSCGVWLHIKDSKFLCLLCMVTHRMLYHYQNIWWLITISHPNTIYSQIHCTCELIILISSRSIWRIQLVCTYPMPMQCS